MNNKDMLETIIEKRDELAVSVTFEKCGAFLKINTDVFGNLNPNEIKKAFGNAIDAYYERLRR